MLIRDNRIKKGKETKPLFPKLKGVNLLSKNLKGANLLSKI